MSWCENCDRNTLELCDRNYCRPCCRQMHRIYDCDRYDGEWRSQKEARQVEQDKDERDT